MGHVYSIYLFLKFEMHITEFFIINLFHGLILLFSPGFPRGKHVYLRGGGTFILDSRVSIKDRRECFYHVLRLP